ncbi:MAG: methyltransferase [Clostridiales bacterium]|nr:methyltransferase [Clostridiales bacterium]
MIKMETLPCGYKYLQEEELFKLGTDSIALSRFATLRKGDRVCDLSSGCGAVMLLIAGRREDITLIGVEIQKRACDILKENIEINDLSGRAEAVCADLREIRKHLPSSSFKLVTANPPYRRVGEGAKCASEELEIARSEVTCTIDDLCAAAEYLLCSGGRLALVHRSDRLTDVLCAMRQHKIEPKRLKILFSASGTPSFILAEGVRGGKSGIIIESGGPADG